VLNISIALFQSHRKPWKSLEFAPALSLLIVPLMQLAKITIKMRETDSRKRLLAYVPWHAISNAGKAPLVRGHSAFR
jgi:hypothetical protein